MGRTIAQSILGVLLPIILNLNIYPAVLEITDLDYENNIIYFENSTGFQYQIYDAPEDLCVGDIVGAIMFENEEPGIADDLVITYRYSGFTIANP